MYDRDKIAFCIIFLLKCRHKILQRKFIFLFGRGTVITGLLPRVVVEKEGAVTTRWLHLTPTSAADLV